MADATLIIKKYGNRRIYDTESSCYITLEDLAHRIRDGRDVRVVDAKSGLDLTKCALLQIISDQEKDHDLLPVSFLKKMIQMGDTSLREALQRYLTVSLETFLNAQKDFEERYRSMAGALLNPMMWMMPSVAQSPTEDPSRRKAAPAAAAPPPPVAPAAAEDTQDQIAALRHQMEQIQHMLSKLGGGGAK